METENKTGEKIGRTKKSDFRQSEASGRRGVLILLLMTIILSIFFWLKKEIPAFWQKMTTPYKIIIEKGGEK